MSEYLKQRRRLYADAAEVGLVRVRAVLILMTSHRNGSIQIVRKLIVGLFQLDANEILVKKCPRVLLVITA